MSLEKTLDEITEIVTKLEYIIEQKNKSGDYFINSLCEDVFIPVFNKLFKCNLKNLNYSKPNAPAIDLVDVSVEKKVIIQVTSTNTPKKLYDTITKYDNNYDNYGEYNELYHFILTKKSKSYNQKEIITRLIKNPEFNFNTNEHIIDIFSITNLLRKIYGKGLKLEQLIEIKDDLEQAIFGFQFKFKSLKSSDKYLFFKTNYKFEAQDELKLERTLINESNHIFNLNDLLKDDSFKYIFIKSDAGYGKSYLLNHTFNFLFENSIVSYENLTPYIMNLKEFNNSTSFKDNINVQFFEKRKKPILILDGLDEITDEEEQKDIENKLQDYLKNHENVKCLISSRNLFKKIKTKDKENNEDNLTFKQFFLSKLNDEQIENYLKSKKIHKEILSDPKFSSIENSLKIPFNLYNVCLFFNKYKKLSDSIIYINHKRIDEDIKKYSKKNEMLLVKTRVFLEKLSVINNIVEQKKFSKREIGKLIKYDNDVYQLLKKINLLYFDEIEENIRFNNNNKYFEDILTTYFLRDKNPENILRIFLINDEEYLIPKSWYNSLSMLISLLGVESSFSKNILQNHPYIIINSEEIGITENQKNKIFQEIFIKYEEKDIWIDDQKFDANKLTNFGDTDENFIFLISKISSENQRTKSKAISLLGDFKANNERSKILVLNLELQIKGNNNKYIIKEIYNSLSKYKNFISKEKQVELVNICAKSEIELLKFNEYVRSGVYNFILTCDLQDDFLNYLFEGLELLKFTNKGKYTGRDNTTLLDEGIYLDRLFFNLKTKTNIAKSFGQLFHSYNCYDDYHASRIFKDLILKSTKIITQEKNIKSFKNKIISILSKYDVKNDNWGYWKEMIVNFGLDRFIIETLKAEYEILENLITSKGIFKNYFLISADGISDIVTNNNYKLIIKVIEDELIKINEAIRIYEFIENKDKKIAEEIQKIIKKKGGVIDTDYEKKQEDIIIEKNRNFELLFNQEKFKKNILKFFAKKEEIELPWNDIPDWYKDNIYFNNDVRVEFLRDLLKGLNGRTVKKIDVIEKLNNNLDWYLVREIFQRKHQLNYNLNKNQILFLNDWVKKEASKLNFRDAIYKVQNSSFSINQNCLTIYKYIKELNIKVDKKTSLDLLSYNDIDSISSNYNDNYSNYFEKLVNQINDFQSVKSRVYENLKNKIKYSTVLNNHIIFSFKYNLIENYKLIEDLLTEFLPELQVGRFHDNPLLVYYDKSKNFEFIKINFPQEVTDLFWAIIDYLIENNEHIKFVEEKLLLNIDKTEDYNEKLKFSNKLLKIHSKNALSKFYTILHYIKENQLKGQFRLHDFNKSIHDYKNAEIETAVNLLELSYKYEFDNFENPAREVSAYLKRMIVEDKENYDKIKNLISEVISLNRGKIENIQFLEYELNNLKEAFYSNYKSNYTLKDALKIISKIEN